MKREKIFHPVVFRDKQWAEGYYKRNKKNIERTGKRLSAILKKHNFSKGKVLDIGCGFASVPIEIAKEFPEAKITGIDLGEPLLEIGNDLIKENGFENQIILKIDDAENLNFKDNSFDLVINTYLLHIVKNPIKMLNEMERIAKPEAKIVLTDLRRGFLAFFIKKFKSSYTLKEAVDIIKKSDLRNGKATKGFFWWDYFVL